MDWHRAIARRLDQIDQAGLRRRVRLADSSQSPRRVIDGRSLLTFASNDYLGLASDPRLVDAMTRACQSHGLGSGAAHLLGGHSSVHEALEARLAAWAGREAALLFSTGYMANLGLVSALCGRHDCIVADRLNHASLIDAVRLSGARHRRYAHADGEAARRRLEQAGGDGLSLVLTDGVFSMDGDMAPLEALAVACRDHQAWLCVDDAHGFGVVGPGGRGSAAALGLNHRSVPVLVGTLGKAIGTFGAFVAGPGALIELLRHEARPYVFTTAPPAGVAAATLRALDLIEEEPWRREHLSRLIDRFRTGANALDLKLLPSQTPIQPIVVGEARTAVAASQALEASGIWVPAVRPPTVPRGESRLRVSLTAAHSESDVDQLLDALAGARP